MPSKKAAKARFLAKRGAAGRAASKLRASSNDVAPSVHRDDDLMQRFRLRLTGRPLDTEGVRDGD